MVLLSFVSILLTDATHIFDGIHSFPTHIVHLQLGSTPSAEPLPWPIRVGDSVTPEVYRVLPPSVQGMLQQPAGAPGIPSEISLLHLALEWLREDRVLRQAHEAARGIKRGRADRSASMETCDAKKFFGQYDYYNNYL